MTAAFLEFVVYWFRHILGDVERNSKILAEFRFKVLVHLGADHLVGSALPWE